MSLKEMWNAPKIKHTVNLKSLVGAAVASSVIFSILMYVCSLLAANSSSFGTTWGPIIGSAATLIVSILTALNLGTPVPPVPPTPTPSTQVRALQWTSVPKEELEKI
jgi:hypothetical protein